MNHDNYRLNFSQTKFWFFCSFKSLARNPKLIFTQTMAEGIVRNEQA
jgi:hypothetical protein